MISKKMIEEFENAKKNNLPPRRGEKQRGDFVILIRRGIFYYLLQEQAEELAGKLGLKLKIVIEKSPQSPLLQRGDIEGIREIKSCGFPTSGLDKYIGKLVRLGRNVIILEDGEVVEKIEIADSVKGRGERDNA